MFPVQGHPDVYKESRAYRCARGGSPRTMVLRVSFVHFRIIDFSDSGKIGNVTDVTDIGETLGGCIGSQKPPGRSHEPLIACLLVWLADNAGRASQRGLPTPCAPGSMVDSSGNGLLKRPLVGRPGSRATFHALRNALACSVHAVITKYFTRRAHVCS